MYYILNTLYQISFFPNLPRYLLWRIRHEEPIPNPLQYTRLDTYNGPKSAGTKGKAVPLQAWSGPERSRKLRFPDFMTTAQDGGKIVSPTHGPPLPQGNTPGTHFY